VPGDVFTTEPTYGLVTLTSMTVVVKRVMRGVLAATVLLAACGGNESGSSGENDAAGEAVVCPAADPADIATGITQERAELLLGFSEADAQRCADELGWAFRVGRRDGESFALTMDYSTQRVTVEVDDDIVTAIVVG